GGKGGERAKARVPADVDAEIGLEPPDRDQDRARYAEALLDARQQAGMLGQKPLRLGKARVDARQSELLEALPEYALPAVERDHLRVGGEAGEGSRESALGNLLRGCFAREGGDERAEVAAAGHGKRRGCGGYQHGCQDYAAHGADVSAISAAFARAILQSWDLAAGAAIV